MAKGRTKQAAKKFARIAKLNATADDKSIPIEDRNNAKTAKRKLVTRESFMVRNTITSRPNTIGAAAFDVPTNGGDLYRAANKDGTKMKNPVRASSKKRSRLACSKA